MAFFGSGAEGDADSLRFAVLLAGIVVEKAAAAERRHSNPFKEYRAIRGGFGAVLFAAI